MPDKIHILLTITDSYAAYCAVTIVSIFENNKGNDFCIHIICEDLSKENKNKLERLFKKYNQEIDIIKPNLQQLQTIINIQDKIPSKYHISVYFRLFAAEYLSKNIERIIYMDCDSIVVGKLRPLWEEDMDENTSLCAAHDFVRISDYHRLKINIKDHVYFNSGVLLINLTYWRTHLFGKQCIDYICGYSESIVYPDQDVLNALSVKKTKYLNLKYNTLIFYLAKKEYLIKHVWYDDWDMIQNAIKSPCVVHFVNNPPWYKGGFLPYRDVWIKYLSMTEWKDIKIGYKGGFMGYCKYTLNKSLRSLIGLMGKEYRLKYPVSSYK